MNNVLISICSLSIGIATTFWVSRYYYFRSIKKEITPFIQNQTSLLWAHRNVKNLLKIEYKGKAIDELEELQFLIANTGERAIKDVISPLNVVFPKNIQMMDADIVFIHPRGREVKIEIDDSSNQLQFTFPLLNRGEYFVVKILLIGRAELKDIKFSILADDIPPELKIRKPNSFDIAELNETSDKKLFKYSFTDLTSGVFFLILSFIMYMSGYFINSGFFRWTNSGEILESLEPYVSIVSTWSMFLFSGLFFLLSIGPILASIIEALFQSTYLKNKKRYFLPKELAKTYYGSDLD